MKYTPGPWTILPEEGDKDYIRIRGTRLGSRYKIANVIAPTYLGIYHHNARETRANTRLIAASPELFEMLCKTIETLEGEGINALDGRHTVQDARNLINKIEGY